MPYSNERKFRISDPSVYGNDDFLSDELPDFSSRRSSYNTTYGVNQKTATLEGESDRNRKISTASNRSTTSNVLEIPGSANFSRQNSMTSTTSLVSNSSVRTFSYQNFSKPKIRNTFGCIIILIGLCLLVIGVCLKIFGDTTSTIDKPIVTNNTNQTNTNSNNNSGLNSTQPYTSPAQTIGYFMLFFGILIILIGISVIFCINSEVKPTSQQNNTFERRVSTIEIEPPSGVAETAINKPQIMITTDTFKDDINYRRFPLPKISIDESTNPNYPTEVERRSPF
jgi:uncharacterized membrane protein